MNSACSYCFGVDLEKLGNMRFGSQLDAHIEIKSTVFDNNTVRRNFSLLHQKGNILRPCIDGISTKAMAPEPDMCPTVVSLGITCRACSVVRPAVQRAMEIKRVPDVRRYTIVVKIVRHQTGSLDTRSFAKVWPP